MSLVPMAAGQLALLGFLGGGAAALDSFDPAGGGAGYPERANGRLTARPSVTALRLEGARIDLDGHLDDEAWRLAEAGTGFYQHEPDRGTAPSQETVSSIVCCKGSGGKSQPDTCGKNLPRIVGPSSTPTRISAVIAGCFQRLNTSPRPRANARNRPAISSGP